MSDQTQTITVASLNIVPVEIKPAADILLVIPDRSAKISYIVGKRVPGKPAIPAIPGIVGRGRILAVGKPGDANYQPEVPAIDGKPTIPEVPAVPDSVITIDQGTVEMTDEEWASWKDQDDTAYRLNVVAKQLGFIPAA